MAEQTKRGETPALRRAYRMGRRQTAVEQTRERIVAAAFDLHATIGPSRTTIRAIAERAGLQRHTVYAHFPELESLYEACTIHGINSTGMPEPDRWRAIAAPTQRLRHGLTEVVAWYRTNEQMLGNVLFDVDPTAPPPTTPDPFEVRMNALHATLIDGWPIEPDRRVAFGAVVSHALAFTTWRSLAGGGLSDHQVGTVLLGLIGGVADGSINAQDRSHRRARRRLSA
jgi:AcrR family transcriptional regulator